MSKKAKPVVEVKKDEKEPVKVEATPEKLLKERYEKENPTKAKMKEARGWLEFKK